MASETYQLNVFVREALGIGKSKEEIGKALTEAGWASVQVRNALGSFADGSFPIPVPRPRPSLNAREAFLYLVMFSALYFGMWNLGRLLFYFVDRAFPDPTVRFTFYDDHTWPTAAIIIAFPIFLFMAQYVGKQTRNNPVRRLSSVRRWLTYLTLFISVITLIGDITELVSSLLGGGLTIRFVLKVLVVAVLAGTVFIYYLTDLRKEEPE
jgi:hypothetical protein